MQALIGVKKVQSQRFLENGRRVPVTLIDVKDNRVISVKTNDRDHYQAIQLGYGAKKKATRAEIGHVKGAKQEKAPKFLREVRVYDDSPLPEVGSTINPLEVFQPGDIVNVTGTSKGKGYAGVVKRHNFKGGPKTHGQSDRHRAPGAIGQGTTPGRVYKGKRMAGRMGNENVTVANLKVIDVSDSEVVINGLVPGIINSLIFIKKVGEDKKFVPLYRDPEAPSAEATEGQEKVVAGVAAEVSAEPVEEPVEAEAPAVVADQGSVESAEVAPEGSETPAEQAPIEETKTEAGAEEVAEDAKS